MFFILILIMTHLNNNELIRSRLVSARNTTYPHYSRHGKCHSGLVGPLVILNFAKASDKVLRRRLLNKPQYYGMLTVHS